MVLRPVFLLLFSLVACAPSAVRPAVAPPSSLVATGTAQRVVLLSFDGLGADGLASQKGLSSFDHLAGSGAVARIVPVNPTLTAPTHVSVLTGADPQVHGVVSNAFHAPGKPPEQVARGLMAEISVETIVEAARRQGKRVGAVPFPTVDAESPRRSADFGLVWTNSLTTPRIVKLSRGNFKRQWVPPTWTQRPGRRTSYSPIMQARVEWRVPRGAREDVDIIAYDTTNDLVENYDLYAMEAAQRELSTDTHGWFAVSKDHHGSWSKVLTTTPSLEVSLYWGAISRTRAYPDSYRDLLDAEVGFWPGAPDEQTGIDRATFAEQLERLSDFLTRAQTLTIQRVPFDLLLAYQPIIDQALHNFPDDDDVVVQRAFAAADRAAGAVGALLDANRDALLVFGDHGLGHARSQLRLGRLLASHGLASRWRAYTAQNVAHIYRSEGTDDTGVVVNLLTATGHFERVERKSAAWHANSGDIIATSHMGIDLSAADQEPLTTEHTARGQHGALNSHRELHTVLFASGFGVRRGNLGEIAQTRIARYVAELLGIEPPAAAQ